MGENNALRIFDVESGALVHEIQVSGLSALFISPDNRVLYWGDDLGNVHLLGVK